MNKAAPIAPDSEGVMPRWTAEEGAAARTAFGEIPEEKIFCIGLGKTGTSTFAKCMRRLGYRHFGSGALDIFKRRDAGAMIELIRTHDSFDDFPFPLMYDWLAVVCENPRFVLTRRRDVDDWMRSLQGHYCRTGPTEAKKTHFGYYSPYQNEAHHRACYERHLAETRRRFKGDPRYVELCWDEGHRWGELCAFLGQPTPNRKFPTANRNKRDVDELALLKRIADAKLESLEGDDLLRWTGLLGVIADAPGFPPASFALGEALRDEGEAALAALLFKLAERLAPDVVRYGQARRACERKISQCAKARGRTSFERSAQLHFSNPAPELCLVLLLERSFLIGLLGLLTSLMRNSSLRGVPIVILTTDPAVVRNPLVQAVATDIRFFDDSDLDRFSKISKKNVLRGERHHKIAKYTLIKFHFFEDFGLGDQIFLDCDMIVTQAIDWIARRADEAPFLAAPALTHDATIPDQVAASIAAGVHPGIDEINSGLMVVSRRFLLANADMVDVLIARAAESAFSKEQKIVSSVMRDAPDALSLPVTCNFLRSYAERMGEAAFGEIAESVRVMHYVQRKPWLRGREALKFFDAAWFDCARWGLREFGSDWRKALVEAIAAAALPEDMDSAG